MTSLQNQIIKYGKKHIGSTKDFFCPWKGSGFFAIPTCAWALNCTGSCPPWMAKCKHIQFCFQKTPFLFGGKMLMEKDEWRLAVTFCRNWDAQLSPVWRMEDPACPKNACFSKPSPPFLLPSSGASSASQLTHSAHIVMVLTRSCREGVLKAGYSARQYQRVRQDPSLFPRAGLPWLCWITPSHPHLLLRSLEPRVTRANLVSLR